MNDFQFLLPDGSYRTTDQERFSAAYQTGAVPIEATPIVDLMAPDGSLVSMHHSEAAPLIREQGYKLSTSPRPLRFSSPDGMVGEIKLGYETEAFRRGGSLIPAEVSLDKPVVPQVKTAAPEEPESPFHTWLGPAPKNPQSLKGWDEYQKVLERNKEARMGFWRALAPGFESIPFVGTVSNLLKSRSIVETAKRLRDKKPVGDQDLMDLNLYLAKQQEVGDASWGGKVGRVIRDSLTFAAEFKIALVPFLFGASKIAPKLALNLAQRATQGALAGSRVAGKASKYLANPASNKALYQMLSADQFIAQVWRPAAKDFAKGIFGAELGKFGILAKGAKTTAAQKAAGVLAEMSAFALPNAAVRVGSQLAASTAAGGEPATFRGNQEILSRVLQGDNPDETVAFWQGVGSEFIEAYTEAMGRYLTKGFTAGKNGIGKLTKDAGSSLGKAIDRMLAPAIAGANKSGAGTATLDLLSNKAKALSGFMTHMLDKAKVGGVSVSHVRKVFTDMGYDGVLEEMLEERAADFFNGLMGWTSYDRRAGEENDDMAIVRAFKNMWPTLEQLSVEAAAFSAPIGVSYLAPIAANPAAFIREAKNASELNMAAGLQTAHLQGKSEQDLEKFEKAARARVLDPGKRQETGEVPAIRQAIKHRLQQEKFFEEAGERDGKIARAFNVLLEKLFSARYHPTEGIVLDPEVGFLATMSAPVVQYAKLGAKRYEEREKEAGKPVTEKQLEEAAINSGTRALLSLGNTIWAYNRLKEEGREKDGLTDEELPFYLDAEEAKVAIHFGIVRRSPETSLNYLFPPDSARAAEIESFLKSGLADLDPATGLKALRGMVEKASGHTADKVKSELENARAAWETLMKKLETVGPAEAQQLANQGILYGTEFDLGNENAPGNQLQTALFMLPLNPESQDPETLKDPKKWTQASLLAKLFNSKEPMIPAEFDAAAALIGVDALYTGRTWQELRDEDFSIVPRIMAAAGSGAFVNKGDDLIDSNGVIRTVSHLGNEKNRAVAYYETADPKSPGIVPLSEIGLGRTWSVHRRQETDRDQLGLFFADNTNRFVGTAQEIARQIGALGREVAASADEKSALKALSPYLSDGTAVRLVGRKRGDQQLFGLNKAALAMRHGAISIVPARLAGFQGRSLAEDVVESVIRGLTRTFDKETGRFEWNSEAFRGQFGSLHDAIEKIHAALAKKKAEGKDWSHREEQVFSTLMRFGRSEGMDVEIVSNFLVNYALGYENMDHPQVAQTYRMFRMLEPFRDSLKGALVDLEAGARGIMGDALFEALRFKAGAEAAKRGAATAKKELTTEDAIKRGEARVAEQADRLVGAVAAEEQRRRDEEDAAAARAKADLDAKLAAQRAEQEREEKARRDAEEAERRKKETDLQRKAREARESREAKKAAKAEKARIAAEEKAAADAKAKAEEEARKKAQAPAPQITKQGSPVQADMYNSVGPGLSMKTENALPLQRGYAYRTVAKEEVAHLVETGYLVPNPALAGQSKRSRGQTRQKMFSELAPGQEEAYIGTRNIVLRVPRNLVPAEGALGRAVSEDEIEVLSFDGKTWVVERPSEFTERVVVTPKDSGADIRNRRSRTKLDPNAALSTGLRLETAQPFAKEVVGDDDGVFGAPRSDFGSEEAAPTAALTAEEVKAAVDDVMSNRPRLYRQLFALNDVGSTAFAAYLTDQKLDNAMVSLIASVLGTSYDKAGQILDGLVEDDRFLQAGRTDVETTKELDASQEEQARADKVTLVAATQAQQENEDDGSGARGLGASNEATMSERNRDMLAAATIIVEAVLGRGTADMASVGAEIRRTLEADGVQTESGVLPPWYETLSDFRRHVAADNARRDEILDNFNRARKTDLAEAGRILFMELVKALPYRQSALLFSAVQNTYGRSVLSFSPDLSDPVRFEAVVAAKDGEVRRVERPTREELLEELRNEAKAGIIEPMSDADMEAAIEEVGGGLVWRESNSAAGFVTRARAEAVAERLRAPWLFSEQGKQLRSHVLELVKYVKDQQGPGGFWGSGTLAPKGATKAQVARAAELSAKEGGLFKGEKALADSEIRLGYVLNEAEHPKAPDWKKAFAQHFAETVSLVLRGEIDQDFVDQFKTQAGFNGGERVRNAAYHLWLQLLLPMYGSLEAFESGRTEEAIASLTGLMEGEDGATGALRKALGIAPGSRFGEIAISAESSKQLYGNPEQPLAKLIELFDATDVKLSGLRTATGLAGGKAYPGWTVATPLARAIEKVLRTDPLFVGGKMAQVAAGKLSRDEAESLEASDLSYDGIMRVLERALRKTWNDFHAEVRGLPSPRPGSIFLPVLLTGDKSQVLGTLIPVEAYTDLFGTPMGEYASFEEFREAVYGAPGGRPGLARAFERAVLDAATDFGIKKLDPVGAADRAGRFKRLKDAFKRLSQIGTPSIPPLLNVEGALRTDADGLLTYVVPLHEVTEEVDGKPVKVLKALKGPGDGLMWLRKKFAKAGRVSYSAAVLQGMMKVGYWGPIGKALRQIKGALTEAPGKDTDGMPALHLADWSGNETPLTPGALSDLLDSAEFDAEAPNASILLTGNVLKLGDPVYEKMFEVNGQKFGIFRAPALGVVSPMPTDAEARRFRASAQAWAGLLAPVANAANPGIASKYAKIVMDEIVLGAAGRVDAAAKRSALDYFVGMADRHSAQAAWAEDLAEEGVDLSSPTGFPYSRGVYFAAFARRIAQTAVDSGFYKAVLSLNSASAALSDGKLAPATNAPIEYGPDGSLWVRGRGELPVLTGSLRRPGSGRSAMARGAARLTVNPDKPTSTGLKRALGRPDMKGTEKERNLEAMNLARHLQEEFGLDEKGFRSTLRLLQHFEQPFRDDSDFIPLDKSTPFGGTKEDALRFIAYLQARQLLPDLADVDPEDGSPRIEYGKAKISDYSADGVLKEDLGWHYEEDASGNKKIIGVTVPGIVFLGDRNPHVGSVQSGRPMRLSRNLARASAYIHQGIMAQVGSDEDGDWQHVFVARPQALIALHRIDEQLPDDIFGKQSTASPDRFSDSWSKEERDSWVERLLPVDADLITDPRVVRASRDANMFSDSAIGRAATALTALNLVYSRLRMPEIKGFRKTTDGDPLYLVRLTLAYDMTQRIVDGAKVPELMMGIGLHEELVPLFMAAIAGYEIPDTDLTGLDLYRHAHAHTVQKFTAYLNNDRKGRQIKKLVVEDGLKLEKAFLAVYGRQLGKNDANGWKLYGLSSIADQLSAVALGVRVPYKFRPHTTLDVLRTHNNLKVLMESEGQEGQPPAIDQFPADHPYRTFAERVLAPVYEKLSAEVSAIEATLASHPAYALPLKRHVGEGLFEATKYKYVLPKYDEEDRKTVVGHEWTAEGKAKLYDFIQEYGMRQGLANMRARQMAKDSPELGAEEIFSRSALADVNDENDLAVFDRVLSRRAELQAVPGYAGNAVLSGIELSYSVRRNGGVIASVRAAAAFSPADAQADWDKLPMAVQIDLFDLITRQTGLAGTDSRLLELVSPSFVSAATAAYKEALRDASVDADMEAAIPVTKHSRQTALDHALYSYFTGLAAEENKKFSRWNGLQSGLKFPDRVVRDKFGKVSEAESSKLYAAYPTSLAYAEPAAAPGRKAAAKEAAPEAPRYPLSRLLESGKVPLVAEFLRRHNATPAAEASEATELDAARALHKLVAGVKGLDIAGGIGQSLALKQLKAHAEALKKEPPAQPETGTPGPTAALTTARYAVSSQSQRDADDRYYDNQKAEKAEFKKEYVASWREFADAFDAVLSDDTQTFEARKRILRGRIAAERRFDRRPGVRPEAQPNAVLKDKLEYLINHIEDEHAEPVAPAAPVAPVQGTFDFGETATLVAPGQAQALIQTARSNQSGESRRPPGAAPTASLVAAKQAETDKGLDGLTMAAKPAKGYWVSKTTNLSDPAAIDNQPYSESNRAGRIAYAQTWRNPPSPGLVAEVTKQLSDAGFVVRNNQSLPGQTATLRPAWAVFEGDRNAIVQAAVDHLVRHSLNEARAGSLAPALSRAVQRNELPLLGPGKDYEGRPLADLVADELVRRMHGSRSLFLHGRNPVSVLVAELAHEIERGHLGDLIRRGELAVKNGYPVLKYRAEPRRIVPDARTDAPAMATFAEVVAASPALAKHKAVFSSAFSAYQVMNRATDLYLHDKLGYDDAMAAVAAAAYSGEFLDTMPADEIAATAALVTSYLPLGGTRAALLRVSGAAGRHYLLFDAMNELNVAYRDAQEHGDWVDRILIGVQGLEGMYWDKTVKNPPNPDGTPSENGAFDPKKRIKLTLEEARSAEDFALLVRNLIQYRHLWEDEANPAASAAWRKEKAVRVAFTPRYEGDAPVRNKRGKLVVEEDTVTLGELFDSVMKSAWRAKMLGEAGREESHLDPFRWAREVAQKFDQDHHIVNTKFAWVFGGQEFIPYRHNYFPLTRASRDKAGPLDQLVGNRFSALQRVADVELSRLNADPGLDAALKTDRKAAAGKLTDGQLALIRELMGEGTAEMESHRREDGYDVESWTAKQAADWIVRRLAGRISQDMREALENSETAPNEAIEAYELSAELKRDMATIAHLRRLTRRTHMTEFAPAELERTSGANDYEAYLHSKELYGDRRELWYRPNSYSFMDSRRQYVKETYAAAVNKAVLGGYLTITDPGGNPSTMALPTDGMDLDRSIVRREDWIRAAKIQSRAAKLEGEDAFTEADASLSDKALVEKLQRVYMKAKDRLGGHDRSTLSTPKTPSISEWTTFDPVSDKLLKHMVQVPFTETNEFWRAMLHAVQWTKHMSIGLSAFFYVALGESSISASGVSRNIVVDFLTDPNFRRQMLDGIKEFKRAREHYNPMVAARMRVMAEAGLEVGKTAATDKPITAVERDIERMTEAVRETRGDRAADIFHAVMAGSDNPSAWARLWPGISGKRWSDAMFAWFSAIKEWQTEQIMIQQAAKEGTLASSALLVPHEYRRRTAQYVNDTLGGQNFSQFIWATPSAMAALNLTLFAPNWTISAFLSSGLGLLTQRMIIPGLGVPAGGAPAPGQVPMIAASLVSMWVIVMQALPIALQSMAYAIGQAAGGDDDDHEGDTPFPWQNEPGREDYIDMTPLARLMPWYKGDPTGKRRSYVQFAKQVHETGVLNPMGTRGWINEPYKQLMRKLSLPAKIVLEQMTGNSPGSDWDLEFKGKGILGALHSGEPGLKGLWTSRAGYVARKFIPISIGQMLENPETFPGMFIAPTSKGASQSKLVDAMAQTLATYASARDMKTIKQTPRAKRRLDGLIPELMLAARRNGYDDQKLLDTARGQVLSGLYKEMWNALDRDDGPGMNQAAAAIFRVGGTLKGMRSSMANRERTYGLDITPEQELQAEEALRRASGE